MKTRLAAAAALVLGTTAALSSTAPGLASAAPGVAGVVTRAHPPILDVAGDAPNPLGSNVSRADIRSADLTLRGRVLTATVTTRASAAGGSGPAHNVDRAPYVLMGVFSDPDGEAVPVRITLDPGGRGVLDISEEVFFEGTTTSSGGVTEVSFTVPRHPISYLSQGVTVRTLAQGFAAFAEVRTAFGTASDRTDNDDFTLGG